MNFFEQAGKKSIRNYLITAGLLLVVGLISYRGFSRLLDHESWVQHTHRVLIRLEAVMSLLKDAETGQRGYLLTGDDDFMEPLRTAQRQTAAQQRALDSLTADNPLQQRRLDTLHALVDRKFLLLALELESFRTQKRYDVARLRESKALMDRLRALISRLQTEEQRLLVLRRERLDEYARYTYPLIWGLSLCFAGLTIWQLRRSQAAEQRVKQESSARFEQLLENIPHMTRTCLPDGTINYFNRQWVDYTGVSVVELLARGLKPFLHPDDRMQTWESWHLALEAGEAMPEIRNRWRGQDGEYRWFLARAVPLRDVDGEISMWVITNTDIHAQQLQQQELERVNEDLDHFVYTASHDLKTPISNIEALLTALREELSLPPQQQAEVQPLLNFMQEAVERFKRTIANMTAVVKLQKSQQQPKTAVALANMVHEVCLDLGPLVKESHAHIDVDVAACSTLLFAEQNLRSILYNLISNALKYRHPSRAPLVQVSCQRSGSSAMLTVRDNGLGMDLDPTRERKLFGLFQRLHDHVEGSGMGLYMVKKIITNAGGRIEVESEAGVGSVFRVYFPQ